MPRSLPPVADISPGKPSTSAQQVALARAHLTWMGVLDDPLAETMLRFPWREWGWRCAGHCHGGPIYVALDLDTADLRETLPTSGFRDADTTVYVVEGLLMYLPEDRACLRLHALSQLGGPESLLVTNFGIGLADDAASIGSRIRGCLIALRDEPFKFRLGSDEAAGFLTQTGWTISTSMSGPEVAQRYLDNSRITATNLNRDSLMSPDRS